VVEHINSTTKNQTWADIGCSTGLLTRIASRLNYKVTGYDLDTLSLKIAKILSKKIKTIEYKKEDLYNINTPYSIVSATSLLSVLDDKQKALDKLISLLKNSDSTLIIIEPTEKLTTKNVWKIIDNIKTFWFYKGLLIWAKARENKHIENKFFENAKNIKITKKYFLYDMVCVYYIQKLY
jgi:2-polyprenyl-3-methyl-5-hydroxy-6-metoxy-1,4-benzoquinol methylase